MSIITVKVVFVKALCHTIWFNHFRNTDIRSVLNLIEIFILTHHTFEIYMAFILVSAEHTDNLKLCFVKHNCPRIGQIYHLLCFPNNVLETGEVSKYCLENAKRISIIQNESDVDYHTTSSQKTSASHFTITSEP